MRVVATVSLAFLLTLSVACGGSARPEAERAGTTPAAGGDANAATDKNAYPVFPNADSGADPSVPADQGGRGFTGEGWQTNTDFDLIGDPRAVKGGIFREAMPDFPATLRYLGPNISVWNQMLQAMAYETLLALHPVTLEYMPALATHWQVSSDKMTYRFRIDPNARFSDGMPVTADDVVASWKLFTDKSVQDPFQNAIFNRFEQPVPESKYIVRVRAKKPGWAELYYFSSLFIYPAHVLKNIDGAAYIREYNDKMLPGSGPYAVGPADIDKGQTVRIRRRTDYWAASQRRSVGTANFDEVREIVVRDRNLEFEMVKRGDLDYFRVTRAQMWVEELNFDRIQQGVLQKRKIWNHAPQSIQGIAFNMRRPPFDDVRVRKALRHLFNREVMIQKLTFNEYLPLNSFHPGSTYENPSNEKIAYDPQKAVQLLAEAGWKERNPQGQLVKGGTPLGIELLYYSRDSERFFTIYQEDLRRVGVNINLRYVTPETGFKLLDDRQFGMFAVGYGGGAPFPFPEQFFSSALADQKSNNNVMGFKNTRVDELLAQYDLEFDVQQRAALVREIDGIAAAQHPYLLEWYAPYERVVYMNKFGQPKGLITRIGDYRDPPSLWWIDRQKSQDLEAALRDPSKKLPVGESDERYWLDFKDVQETQAAATAQTGAR